MTKQTILSVLLIAILFASSTLAASPIFSFSKLFETSGNKRAPTDSNLCCLPTMFSLKGTFNQVSTIPNNSTLQIAEGSFTLSADYNSGKLRQDISASTNNGDVISYSNLDIKVSSSLTVSYDIQNGKCNCRKISDWNQWQPLCIPSQGSVTKAKIGSYDALKTVNTQYGATGTIWAFREPQMASDRCWMLSSYVVVSTAAQEQTFYDMVEKVDPNAFAIPPQCPSLNTCLNQ